jgi:hypothetical protein
LEDDFPTYAKSAKNGNGTTLNGTTEPFLADFAYVGKSSSNLLMGMSQYREA